MSDKVCILCSRNTNDTLQLGEKITCEDVTAHLYCLLLTSNLVQHGEDDEGITGFLPKDIKSEVSRTKKLFCHYCHEKSATIGCCQKSCRRSFHLPCAIENDCRFEFKDPFQSFCDAHHNIKKPKNAHKPTDLCIICYDEMGAYNPIRSIPLPCCDKNSWCHKLCLQQYAQTSGYFLKCPLCKDTDIFREWISRRGVSIPDRDAKWEVDENGPNSFYGFEQHSERPIGCEAKKCRCPKGRTYKVDLENHKYSMLYCDHCGSHAIHFRCFNDDDYLCDECTAIEKRRQENMANSLVSNQGRSAIETQASSSVSMHISSDVEERFSVIDKILAAKHNLREFSILLRRLTPADLGFKLEPNSSESESDTTDTNRDGQSSDSSSDCQTDGSSSDESVIKIKNKKPIVIDSESENDVTLMPENVNHIYPRNQFGVSDDDEKPISSNFDINENSKNLASSNFKEAENSTEIDFLYEQSCKQIPVGLKIRQISCSDDDNQIRPTSSKIQKEIIFDSSDDQTFGKENERPSKSIAVVRPFARTETSSDECIKPVKLSLQSHPIFSSSDEPYSDFTDTTKMEIDDENRTGTENHTITNHVKQSPGKRKRQTVLPYFRDTSSSDEEPVMRKIRKKSPNKKQRTQMEIAPNQSTIYHFFKKQ